jgi:hypothetical protein
MAWADPIMDNGLPNVHALSGIMQLIVTLNGLWETGIILCRQRRFASASSWLLSRKDQSGHTNLAALRRRLPYGSVKREFNPS